jgi:hypothetical protein
MKTKPAIRQRAIDGLLFLASCEGERFFPEAFDMRDADDSEPWDLAYDAWAAIFRIKGHGMRESYAEAAQRLSEGWTPRLAKERGAPFRE